MKVKTTLDQWQVFEAIVTQGGYAKAAEYLHRSQSTISYTIAQLQTQLNVKLFETAGRKATLTPLGELLFNRSRILLEDAQRIEKIAHLVQTDWPAEVVVVVDDPFPRQVLAQALKMFKSLSDTRVQLLEVSLSSAIEALHSETGDIVICHQVPKGYIEFAQAKITQIAVAHKNHELHQFSSPSVEDLKREVQLVIRDSGVVSSVDKGWLDSPNRWRISSSQLAIQLLCEGIGYAWMPSHYLVGHEASLKPIELTQGKKRRFFLNLIYGKKSAPNKAAFALGKCFQEVLVKWNQDE